MARLTAPRTAGPRPRVAPADPPALAGADGGGEPRPALAALRPRRWSRAIARPARIPFGSLLLIAALAGAEPAEAADSVRITTARLDLVISLAGAVPLSWRACDPSCASADAGRGTALRFVSEDDSPQPRLVLRGSGGPVDLLALRFTADVRDDPHARVATFEAALPVDGARLAKSFAVSRDRYEVAMTVRLLGPNAAQFSAGRGLELGADGGLFPAPAAGFSAVLDRVRRVVVGPGGVRVLGDDGHGPVPLGADEWAGFRSRFWAMLARPDGPGALEPRPGPALALLVDRQAPLTWRYVLYSGPVEYGALRRADPELGRMLFAGLWSWLRPLSFGLLFLLRRLSAVAGDVGLGIIALAVAVKILLLPLTALAHRLQEQVNQTQARLQPGIDAIKAAHRGEERTRRTLALYREEGVHPLYTLKSLVGFLIQLPVFVAVFDMLAEDFDLYRRPFLWIRDLSRPDELLRLPTCVPFFGCHLNLLPFLMTGVSVAALLRFHSPVLTPALVHRQRRNLVAMAALFFVLFYTFPAGMILYWTSTNAVQLAGQELGRVRRDRHRPGPRGAG